MELMDGLMKRRSIRRFAGDAPSVETMRRIVRAGMLAASAGNGQPWRFITVLDAQKVEAVTDALGWLGGDPGPGERPRAHVVILTPEGASWAAEADGAAAAGNMQLAAFALELGSCWFGSIKREKVAGLLGIPAEWHVYSIVAFGEPAEEPELAEGTGRPARDASGKLSVPKKALDEVMTVDGFESGK